MKFSFVLNSAILAAIVVFLCLVLRDNHLLAIQEHRDDLEMWELCENGHGRHMIPGRCEEAELGLDRPPYIRAVGRLMMHQIPETVARAFVYVLSNVFRTAAIMAVLFYLLWIACSKLLVLHPKDRQTYWDVRPYCEKYPASKEGRDDHEPTLYRRRQSAEV